MPLTTKRVFVLVKAYPQPSVTYGETVCCAGITEEGDFVRLYPVRYRRLKRDARFDRFDLIEVQGERPRDDHRPESFHVDEASIRIVRKGKDISAESKARLWAPHVSKSLAALRARNSAERVSLGIVRPDPGSLRFKWVSPARLHRGDRDINDALLAYQTNLLDEKPLKPLAAPEWAFRYTYQSDGLSSTGQIHDWEVQEAHRAYKVKYGDRALEMLRREYQVEMPRHNLHLFLGTMKAHPTVFIIVGLLRTSANLDALAAQSGLCFR